MSKYFKNPQREKDNKTYEPYVPEYQARGISLEDMVGKDKMITTGASLTVNAPVKSFNNPRQRPEPPESSKNVPFADISIKSETLTQLPNVGNNIEHMWSGDIIDDVDLDQNEVMIDNNLIIEPAIGDMEPKVVLNSEKIEVNNEQEYMVIVSEQLIHSGNQLSTEDVVRQLIFGEHSSSSGVKIDINDILVLKRVKIKMGVFIEV